MTFTEIAILAKTNTDLPILVDADLVAKCPNAYPLWMPTPTLPPAPGKEKA